MLTGTSPDQKLLLVGDNPFLGVSHLSQERANARGADVTKTSTATELVGTALENGANGFLFSVSELSLSILSDLRTRPLQPMGLYPIVPWSFEYVRAAVRLGGLPGVAKMVGRRVVGSANVYAVMQGLNGLARNDVRALFKAYLSYEAARVRTAAGRGADVRSFLLHEIVTDMALGLEMDWLFRAHVEANHRARTKPGFNTRNLPFLANRFADWGISLSGAVIAAPFNAEGFQMCPSKEACEETLKLLRQTEVVGFSVLAAGHLPYQDAIDYVVGLPNLRGVAVGVSNLAQARTTFKDLQLAFQHALPQEGDNQSASSTCR